LRFIARQPIFDRQLRVFGYELLFREGFENFACITDSELAARSTLDNSMLWGLDQLCDGKLALVNCTRDVVTSRLVELLPPSTTVVEVLEGTLADREMVEACRSLGQKGYMVALDDISSIEEIKPYLGIADLVKVDFRLVVPSEQAELAKWLDQQRIIALAEKVETKEEYRLATAMGYGLFQGYFLQRPEILRTRDIPAVQANYARLLSAIQGPDLDFKLIEDLVRREPSLCFRLLRFLNSSLFAFEDSIDSVHHALRLLGERNIRNWLLVAVTSALGRGKASELVVWALTRARFCELTSGANRQLADEMFLLGMLSAFPALLEASLETILGRIAIAPSLKSALLGEPGPESDILELLAAYESGDWPTCIAKTNDSRLTEDYVCRFYLEATRWADEVTRIGECGWCRSQQIHSTSEYLGNSSLVFDPLCKPKLCKRFHTRGECCL